MSPWLIAPMKPPTRRSFTPSRKHALTSEAVLWEAKQFSLPTNNVPGQTRCGLGRGSYPRLSCKLPGGTAARDRPRPSSATEVPKVVYLGT